MESLPSYLKLLRQIPRRWHLVCGAALLCYQTYTASVLSRKCSVTLNELAHIPAGLAAWEYGDFSLYNVNPPLARLFATIPLLSYDDLSLAALSIPHGADRREEFMVGAVFCETNSKNYHDLVVSCRLAGIIWVFLGGLVVWAFASEAIGPHAGLASVGFWVGQPFITSHGAIATPDIPATVLAVATVYLTWRCLHRQSNMGPFLQCLVIALLIGIGVLTKFTNLLLVPVVLLMVLTEHRPRPLQVLAYGTVGLFVLTATLWCGYMFDSWGTSLNALSFRSELLVDALGTAKPFEVGCWSTWPIPLPLDMLVGIDRQQVDFEGRQLSYLRGVTSDTGWFYYYVYGLLIKLTIGLLIALFGGLLVVLFDRNRDFRALKAIVIPAVIYVGVASAKYGYTNHVRYVLPAVPFLIIFASRIAERIPGVPLRYNQIGTVTLVLASLGSSLLSFPNWLGYFNEAVGGPNCGWLHLEDSNVDWGQDLILLRDWCDAHPDLAPIALRTRHMVDPRVYLGDRMVELGRAKYVVVDAYSLVHDRGPLRRSALVDRVGVSLFVFDVGAR